MGLGQIGMGYDLHLDPGAHIYSHARAFTEHPGFELLAGVDPDEQRRGHFEQAYGRPSYRNLAEALGCHSPDVVAIACPTPLHSQVLAEALGQSRPRAVLCEKPLAHSVAEAAAMVRSCEDRNVPLFVNYMRRADPGVIEIKNRIARGEIATPVKGVAWYSKGFFHNGSHFFNLLEYWLGSMQGATVVDRGRRWDNVDPEPDARVAFANGTISFLAAREEHFSHYTVELVTANGRLRYDDGGESIEWRPARPDPAFAGYFSLSVPESIASGMSRYQWHVADQLAAALAGRPYHLCTGTEALTTLTAMHEVLTNHDDRH